MRNVLLAIVLLCLTVGCGQKEVQGDPAPFAAAIVDYLQVQSMGMKVNSFKTLKMQDAAATALVSLSAADEGVAPLAVLWQFTFAKQDDGTWKVTGYEVK